jgi:PAS domain S-box-containing protein
MERLVNERALSDLIIESSADGIIVVDTELRYIVWNPAIESIHGKTCNEVVGKTVFDVDPGFANHQIGDAWRRAISGQRAEIRDFRFFSRARSADVIYDADFTPLYSPARAIVGAICVLHEITDRRRAEETLRQAQKMEAIGQLTAGVAHDFNNILQVILGNLTMIQRWLPQGRDESKLAPLVAAAIHAGNRAATLTAQLLAFSRRQPLQPKPLDVNRLLGGMSELLHHALGETVEVETMFAEGVWQTMADANQLESAVLNLAVNARDAMPNGGKLMIETTNAFLDEAFATSEPDLRAGQYVVIAVTDTGSGMPPEVVAKAFDPFFTTKDIGQGTGLGLAQVYGFIKQSGGHAKIYSEPGAGSTVKLYLPRLAASVDAEPASAGAETLSPTRGKEAILVVEDEEDVRALVADMLRELGYDVLEAGDGQAALGLLYKRPDIRLLFTDVGLPGGIDGRQLAERARVNRPDLIILYTSGYARNAIVHQDRLDPGIEVINKPFTYAALAARIREALDRAL